MNPRGWASRRKNSRGTGSTAVPYPGEAVQGREEPCQQGPGGPRGGGTGERLWLRWRTFYGLVAPRWDYNAKWTWLLWGGKSPLFSKFKLLEVQQPHEAPEHCRQADQTEMRCECTSRPTLSLSAEEEQDCERMSRRFFILITCRNDSMSLNKIITDINFIVSLFSNVATRKLKMTQWLAALYL